MPGPEAKDWKALEKELTQGDAMLFDQPDVVDGKYTMRARDYSLAEPILEKLKSDGLVASFSTTERNIKVFDYDKEGLDKLEEESERLYDELGTENVDKAASELGLNEHADPDIGQAFGIFAGGESTFPYHWAGVVAKAGSDSVTLENYAGDDRKGTDCYFALYGPLTNTSMGEDGLKREETSEKERRSTTFHGHWSTNDFHGVNTVTGVFGKKLR